MLDKMKYLHAAIYYCLLFKVCYCQTTLPPTVFQTVTEEYPDDVTKQQEPNNETTQFEDVEGETQSTQSKYSDENLYKGTDMTPEEVQDFENILGKELDEIFGPGHPAELNIDDVKRLLVRYDQVVAQKCYNFTQSMWNHMTNLRDEEKSDEKVRDVIAYHMVKGSYLKILRSVDLDKVSKIDEDLAQNLKDSVSTMGISMLSSDDANSLQLALSSLESSYRSKSADIYRDGTHTSHRKFYQPAVDIMLSEPSYYHRLLHYWTSWHNSTTEDDFENYQVYVEKYNLAAKLQGYDDGSDMLKEKYKNDDLMNTLEALWLEIKPLYQSLHEFLIMKIKKRYGNKYKLKGNYIPAHLLGSTSGESWTSLYHIVKPYPDSPDLLKSLAEGLEPWSYCRAVDTLLKSLGFTSIQDPCVSTLRMFRPEERDSDCHPRLYDFCNGKEYRLQICNFNGVDALKDLFYQMGLMEYSIYHNGSALSANRSPHQGFAEAFGNILAEQVSMDFLLKNMQLDEYGLKQNHETEMNNLMLEALRVLPSIAYALAVDTFRWDTMAGDITKDLWNEHWWNLRKEFQFVAPPAARPKQDFDPAANYDIVMDRELTPKFLGYVMSYEILKSLCQETSKIHDKKIIKNKLHRCNLFASESAGIRLREFFTNNSTNNWLALYSEITEDERLSTSALLEYFKPLRIFMDTYEEPELPAKNQYMAIAIGIGVFSAVLVAVINIIYIMKKIKDHKEKKKGEQDSLQMGESKKNESRISRISGMGLCKQFATLDGNPDADLPQRNANTSDGIQMTNNRHTTRMIGRSVADRSLSAIYRNGSSASEYPSSVG